MKHSKIMLAGVAVAMMAGGAVTGFAQGAPDAATGVPMKRMVKTHGHAARIQQTADEQGYRPLTVGAPPVVATPATAVGGIGDALASPFNSAAGVGGPIGAGFGIAGSTIGGATTLATAPLAGLFGGPVGISPTPASPLPIKARYANTGAVESTIAEGYTQDVPVDKSGPIYQIDPDAPSRKVTPFSLLAFPITGVTSAITTPLRPATVVQ